jgi:hypothetical protein
MCAVFAHAHPVSGAAYIVRAIKGRAWATRVLNKERAGNFNGANGFDTDDTSTLFYMLRNVQVGGFYLKSDFGGSEIEYEGGLHVSGGIGSNGLASRQYQPIPSPNLNFVRNCTLMHFGSGGSEDLQSPGAPCLLVLRSRPIESLVLAPGGRSRPCWAREKQGRRQQKRQDRRLAHKTCIRITRILRKKNRCQPRTKLGPFCD